ncbi:hypothetical protein AQUSIP_02180 [Aquicella siphonis]|uniref:Uncharacterized protein n=1 Tax=Aquicella siphonis TaxID=254247 RepID=A0A5E4PDS7_9COXI|nr:hypothetical protein [Aquicella siphonis]VVC74944.1 hypothetical protein AQUSIP_02180 [Aquicella siphonis]
MALTRKRIDYMSVPYSRTDADHQEFIEQEIALFHANYTELCNYDKRTECVAALLALAWFFGSVGTVGALFICLAYAGMSHELFGRIDYARQHQSQLQKLLDLYKWCCARDQKIITSDPTFLRLAETIVPFVEYQDLKKPLGSLKNISEGYARVLAQHPLHHDEFLRDIKTPEGGVASWVPEWLSRLFAGKKDDDHAEAVMPEGNKTWSERCVQSFAQTRFTLYGRQTKPPQSYLEQGRQLIQPVLMLKKS